MLHNIKNLKLNNILFYFLLILIILAGGILIKKYTNIYEGYTDEEVENINKKTQLAAEFFDGENTKMENEMEKLNKEYYDKMVEAIKKNFDLKLKSAIWKHSKKDVIEKAYKDKELYDKITSSGGSTASISNSLPSTSSGFGGW